MTLSAAVVDDIRHPAWHEELTGFLGPRSFPASHDDLVATLVRRHAPSRLLWHLSVVPRTRRFGSLVELLECTGRAAAEVPESFVGEPV